ncbi:hypothetical protein MMC2321_03335 [Chitinophaga sp. MM2321]
MEQLVAEHPYFSTARLLLAKKVYSHTSDLRNAAVKKAMLYTVQPHHFYQFITNAPVATTIPEPLPVDTVAAVQEETPEEIAPVVAEEEEIAVAATMTAIAEEEAISAEETMTAAVEEEEMPVEETMTAITQEEIPAEETIMTAAVQEDEIQVEETVDATTVTLSEAPAEKTGKTTSAAAEIRDTPDSTLPIKIFPLALPEEEETVLTYQPLYTDDYFAYKRLKDPGGGDELNDQGMAEMRSFTSWLKEIKDSFAGKTSKDWYHQQLHRIYEEDEEPEVSETVERMAMDSITFNNDIVSETLAEIWVRQQQYSNAIRIYQKLSLLNPDKNAYFAQKIQELKSQTDKNKR